MSSWKSLYRLLTYKVPKLKQLNIKIRLQFWKPRRMIFTVFKKKRLHYQKRLQDWKHRLTIKKRNHWKTILKLKTNENWRNWARSTISICGVEIFISAAAISNIVQSQAFSGMAYWCLCDWRQISLWNILHSNVIYIVETLFHYANKSYNKNVMKRPAWIFHLDNFVTTQNLMEHLVKLIAKKLLSVETLKQQAEVINKVWCQLERLIKSYHITMLKSKFPPNVSNPVL